MKEENKRSKYWNELVEVLEQEFPKGECKERGGALVLLSYAEMALQKQKTELEKAAREEAIKECIEAKPKSEMILKGQQSLEVYENALGFNSALREWEQKLKELLA